MSLTCQEQQLRQEINDYIGAAVSGCIPLQQLTFAANKIFKASDNTILNVKGSVGGVFAKLAETNCDLWHEQEKVYEFEKVPVEDKNRVVKRLALLNLERAQCIDEIDRQFSASVSAISLRK